MGGDGPGDFGFNSNRLMGAEGSGEFGFNGHQPPPLSGQKRGFPFSSGRAGPSPGEHSHSGELLLLNFEYRKLNFLFINALQLLPLLLVLGLGVALFLCVCGIGVATGHVEVVFIEHRFGALLNYWGGVRFYLGIKSAIYEVNILVIYKSCTCSGTVNARADICCFGQIAV